MKTAVCVIPARLESARLPRKLLLRETGRHLIEHTIEAALACDRFHVVCVATDDDDEGGPITGAIRSSGVDVIGQTDREFACGTDRVAGFIGRGWPRDLAPLGPDTIVVNLQADEPEISPEALGTLIRLIEDGAEMATLARDLPIRHEEYADENCVKVLDAFGEAVAFTRRDTLGMATTWHPHIGAYAFTRDALARFAAHGPTRFERANRLEQLRASQMDPPLRIALALVEHEGAGINTRADYEAFAARELARNSGTGAPDGNVRA